MFDSRQGRFCDSNVGDTVIQHYCGRATIANGSIFVFNGRMDMTCQFSGL